jgi:hypothetical protein
VVPWRQGTAKTIVRQNADSKLDEESVRCRKSKGVVLGVVNPGPGLSNGDGRLHHVNFGVNEYVEKQAKNRVRGVGRVQIPGLAIS